MELTSSHTTVSVRHVWPTFFLYSWSVGIDLVVWQL